MKDGEEVEGNYNSESRVEAFRLGRVSADSLRASRQFPLFFPAQRSPYLQLQLSKPFTLAASEALAQLERRHTSYPLRSFCRNGRCITERKT